jgi:hypothetical protein
MVYDVFSIHDGFVALFIADINIVMIKARQVKAPPAERRVSGKRVVKF